MPVDTSQVDSLARRLQDIPDQFDKRKKAVLTWIGDQLRGVMIRKLEPIRYTGEMQASVGKRVEKDAVVIGPNVAGVSVAPAKVKNIWQGGPPRTEAIEDLEPWVAVKLGGTKAETDFGLSGERGGSTSWTRRAAYAVQANIQKVGTSSWQMRERGTMGFPFPEETLADPTTDTTLEQAAKELEIEFVRLIEGA
jgi:hypothetical protein